MSRRRFIASLSTLLCVAPFLEGVVVNNATDLNNAIIAANAAGDPSIQFGGLINLTTLPVNVLQPLTSLRWSVWKLLYEVLCSNAFDNGGWQLLQYRSQHPV